MGKAAARLVDEATIRFADDDVELSEIAKLLHPLPPPKAAPEWISVETELSEE